MVQRFALSLPFHLWRDGHAIVTFVSEDVVQPPARGASVPSVTRTTNMEVATA